MHLHEARLDYLNWPGHNADGQSPVFPSQFSQNICISDKLLCDHQRFDPPVHDPDTLLIFQNPDRGQSFSVAY